MSAYKKSLPVKGRDNNQQNGYDRRYGDRRTQLYRMQGGQVDEIVITFKYGKTRIENIE